MTELAVPSVNERDIDLLLLEEVVASPAFLSWFLSSIGLPDVPLVAAARSVSTETGESDIELTVRCDSGLTKVLIENKIDAPLQPRQPERYTERARNYVQHGVCSAVVTVIAAPSRYLAGAARNGAFDTSITYESILEWFEAAQHLGKRQQYKTTLLHAAIQRGQIGWQLVPNEMVTKFWHDYWQYATRHFPALHMKKPSAKPASSGAIFFKPLALPKEVTLRHDMNGQVNLLLAGQRARIADLQAVCGHRLRADMRLEPAAQSAVIRIDVPYVDMAAGFEASEHKVSAALQAASDLVAWYAQVFGGAGAA